MVLSTPEDLICMASPTSSLFTRGHRLKEFLKYAHMSPSRQESYSPILSWLEYLAQQSCLFVALDHEAGVSPSGVPSGLEPIISLAVFSVFEERAGPWEVG